MITKSRCPACAKKGKDTHGDNLVTYPDGHSYCFSCGYGRPGSIENRLQKSTKKVWITVALPEDFDFKIPEKAEKWVHQFLTPKQLRDNTVGWSEEEQKLIFPFLDPYNTVLGWQGRYFGDDPTKPKWFSQGNLQDIYHILPIKSFNTKDICLVEDIISAIKVSDVCNVMPLFGAVIAPRHLTRLHLLGYNKIHIWLDPDKHSEMVGFAQQARTYGFSVHTILSNKDPKYYSFEEIKKTIYE